MSYSVRIESRDDCWALIVEHGGKIVWEETDYGEPEDNSFVRDYAWVKDALEDAYKRGYADAWAAIDEREKFPRF